jgi:hypothetical protein
MAEHKGLRTWTLWGAGALAAVLGVVILCWPRRSEQPGLLPPMQLLELPGNQRMKASSDRTSEGIGRKQQVSATAQNSRSGAHGTKMTQPSPPFFSIYREEVHRALDDPDPAIRLGGIQTAVSRRGEQAFELLSVAARSDYEPDNRLSAVSELEQMLKSNLGDPELILHLLEETASDPDPRVSELSKLIIQEQCSTRD